jgi:hypothetical protein
MRPALAMIFMVAALSGCATHGFKVERPSVQVFYAPGLEMESAVQVGESIVSVVKQESVEAYKVDSDVVRRIGKDKALVFPKGSSFGLIGRDAQGPLYATAVIATRELNPDGSCVIVAGACDDSRNFDKPDDMNQSGFRINSATGKIDLVFDRSRFARVSSYPAEPFEVRKIGNVAVSFSQPEFRRELIYSGVSGSTLSLSYREFSRDFARPAFTQDLKYDLSQGTTIGYKGARFEVIKADNVSLRYRVLAHLE